jgi:hypothetical protein
MGNGKVAFYEWEYEGLTYSVDHLPDRHPRLCGEYPPDLTAGMRAASTEILRLVEERDRLRAHCAAQQGLLLELFTWADGLPPEPERAEIYFQVKDLLADPEGHLAVEWHRTEIAEAREAGRLDACSRSSEPLCRCGHRFDEHVPLGCHPDMVEECQVELCGCGRWRPGLTGRDAMAREA